MKFAFYNGCPTLNGVKIQLEKWLMEPVLQVPCDSCPNLNSNFNGVKLQLENG